ncbi:MAG: phosphonate ABC transporter, permease protein PhnE [Bdellovibrionales bacterium]
MFVKNHLHRFLFDAIFFTYGISLAVYGMVLLLAPDFATQDNAVLYIDRLLGALALSATAMAALTALLHKFKISTLGEFLFAPQARRAELSRMAFFKSFWGLQLTITFLLTFIVSLKMTEFSIRELTDPEGFAGAMRLYHGLTHANLALLPTAIVQVIETIFIAFLATVIAVPPAFVLSFLSARNVMTHPAAVTVYALLRTFLNLTRSVEPLIWALIFTVWVGVGPFAGMLALMIHSMTSLAKQFSEIIEDASEGPVEAIRSTGAGQLQVVWFGLVPQILMPFISFVIYRWDTNVRMATVIGLVGGGGIGTLLLRYQGQAMWPEVGCIILVIAGAVWLMDLASSYIREALR